MRIRSVVLCVPLRDASCLCHRLREAGTPQACGSRGFCGSRRLAAAPAAAPAADGKTLFDQKCSVCHALDRATARTESKEKWGSIVKDMQGKKADWISDVDAAKIVEYPRRGARQEVILERGGRAAGTPSPA